MGALKFRSLLRPDTAWGQQLVARLEQTLPGAQSASYGTRSGAVTLDLGTADVTTLTLGGNVTLTLRPAPAGTVAWLQLTQDGTGGRTVALSGGVCPGWTMTATASKSDLLGFVYVGSQWVGTTHAQNY